MSRFLRIDDVMELTGYRRNSSYKLIRELNAELEATGRMTFPGKVDRAYFMHRVFGEGDGRWQTGT